MNDREFWETCLNTVVEMREGFYDECGEFVEMQNNPYSPPHKTKHLCYLEEKISLTEEEHKEYERDFEKGMAHFIPVDSNVWRAVPEFTLDDLFKHAVPTVLEKRKQDNTFFKWKYLLDIWLPFLEHYEPAIALHKAIEKEFEQV